ncbi:MAG TPA: hypothetical protein DIW17_18465, partial [Clostridiales bacterium]|nr:hypothetical protein [Clostridiales bacterium]
LIIHTSFSPANANVLLKNASDSYTSGQVFDTDTLSYTLDTQTDSVTQLRFRANPAEVGAKVTLHYGEESKDITWTSGSSKWANCLTGGKNVLTIVVTPPESSSKLPATYTFNVDCMPSLTTISAGTGAAELYLDKTFSSATTEYTLNVPDNLNELIISASP